VADLGYYIAGFVAVLAACLKLFVGRERERPAGAYYLDGVLACLGLSGIVLAPTTLRAAATIEPIPNLTRLVGNGLTAGAAFCMVALLAHAAYPAAQVRRRVRAQAAILFVALIAMAALLTAASTRFTVDFVNVYANHPLVAAYEVVFLSYVTWALTGTAVLVHRIAKHARRTFFRAGLRMLTAGAVLGLSWAVWKIVVTLLKVTTDEAISAESPVSSVLSAASILLIALGATLTVWGPRAAHPAQWLRARRVYRRIEPLWSALHDAVPEVEFEHPGAGLEFRLYHRIVEIRDSSLALRVHFHPETAVWVETDGRAAGIEDETELSVLAEAAGLAGALEAHRAGHRYHDDPSTAAIPRQLDPDIDVEARWLIRVATAFERSPVVESIRRRVRDDLSGRLVSGPESPTG
jgi:hypothetical protein